MGGQTIGHIWPMMASRTSAAQPLNSILCCLQIFYFILFQNTFLFYWISWFYYRLHGYCIGLALVVKLTIGNIGYHVRWHDGIMLERYANWMNGPESILDHLWPSTQKAFPPVMKTCTPVSWVYRHRLEVITKRQQ